MTATMHLEDRYDADVETVYQLITDPEFMTRKYTELGGKDVAVDRTDTDDGGCELVTRRTVTVDLPGFAKKVMQPSNTAMQTETWAAAEADGRRVCTYHVEIQGMPSKVTGTVVLARDGDGTTQVIDADVKISIPLIGGRLEKFGVETGKDDLGKQVAFTKAELARI
jgi:uncharacterized protein YndB with AHSA1/START domain